jgi:hypothetical protein
MITFVVGKLCKNMLAKTRAYRTGQLWQEFGGNESALKEAESANILCLVAALDALRVIGDVANVVCAKVIPISSSNTSPMATLSQNRKRKPSTAYLPKRTEHSAPLTRNEGYLAAAPLAELELYYTQDELESFLTFRLEGLSPLSLGWPRRAVLAFWEHTRGIIAKERMEILRRYALDTFHGSKTQANFLSYARAFLTYLAKTRLDIRYESFKIFLEMPKALKIISR